MTSIKFELGQVVATPGALEALREAGHQPAEFLDRHARGDWGDLDEEDRRLNDLAIVDGSRILSSYKLTRGEKVWLITEATDDGGRRSCSTFLLPDEY